MGVSPSPSRVLILMSRTGGGHLRAAEAVAEAVQRRCGHAVSVEVVDALSDYAPFPFSRLGDVYPYWINWAANVWGWGYRLTDGPRRATALLRLFWPVIWPRMRLLLRQHPADVFVSVHPLTNHYIAWALARLGLAAPTLSLVTDPVTVHPFWISPAVDRYLLGSTNAKQKALACGLTEGQVRVTGLPVNPRFVEGLLDRAIARQRLGWDPDLPAVLLIGGSEGVGHISQTARALDAVGSDIQVAVVAGRNQRLRDRLLKMDWRIPTHVYGFVDHLTEMPCLMSAADLLVTKAGPASLHEAFLAGLPIILNQAVPGQEQGNVDLVVDNGAGVWASEPTEVALLSQRLLKADTSYLASLSARSAALARPRAAVAVVDEVLQFALTQI